MTIAIRMFLLLAATTLIPSCNNEIGKDLGGPGGTLIVPLAAPSGLTATPQVSTTSISLSWADNSSGETGFRVEVNDAPFGAPPIVFVAITSAGATSYTWTGFANTTYYFRVYAVTATLQSDPTSVVTATTLDPPPTPSGFTATVVSTSRIDLSWIDVANETGYRIERSLDGGNSWATLNLQAANATAYSDLGLAADTTYTYRLLATNMDGDSSPTPSASAMTLSASMTLSSTATAGIVGQFTSIAVTPAGVPHVAHYDVTNGNVLYTTTGGAPLAFTTVDTGPTGTQDVGATGTAIVLDNSGFYHIAAQDLTSSALRYITNASGSVVATTLDSVAGGLLGQKPRMAYHAATDTLTLAYHRFPPASSISIRVATKIGAGAWTFEDISTAVDASSQFSLAVDSSGTPQLALTQAATFYLYHAVRTGPGAWTLTQIPVSGGSPYPIHTAIAIDGAGFPHVAYYEFFSQDLFHATNTSGSWVSEPIHQLPSGMGNVGQYPSMSIDLSSGRIHVAYYDSSNGDLRYARKDPAGSWILRLIDLTGDVGKFTGVAVDGSGQAWISYFDATNGELKIANGSP